MTNANPEIERVLRARAQALARVPEQARAQANLLEVLEFRLASERYAVETRHIQEVHPFRELTPLPCTPAFVLGVVNVRGRILPVLDIKRFFGLPEQGLVFVIAVDHVLDMGRTATNVLGNAVAAALVAKWEGELKP